MDTIIVNSQMADSLQVVAAMVHDSVIASVPDTLVVVQQATTASSFLGLSPEWWAIIITLVVFGLGYLVDARIKRKARLQETEDYRNTVFKWFELSAPSFIAFSENLVDFRKRIHDNRHITNPYLVYNPSMIDSLDIITTENILKYFVFNSTAIAEDKRSEQAYNIISSIEKIKFAEDQIMKNYEDYLQNTEEIGKDWNSCLFDINRQIRDGAATKEEEPFFALLQTLLRRQYENDDEKGEPDVEETNREYIQPLLDSLKLLPESPKNSERAYRIAVDIRFFAHVYDRWRVMTQRTEELYGNYNKFILNAYNSLLQAIMYFKENTKAKK